MPNYIEREPCLSSLKFGTSGLRGLAQELDGAPAYRFTRAFVAMLAERGVLSARTPDVLLGRDLRPSSLSIACRCAAAIADAGFRPLDCGALPTPALALAAMRAHAPSIMVTGSHIPAGRNGLKFYRPDGEIDKADEEAILRLHADLSLLPGDRSLAAQPFPGDAIAAYIGRYTAFFDAANFAGLRVGVYQQSSVARDLLVQILEAFGIETIPFARSDVFLPVDTEAVRAEDVTLMRQWAGANPVDAIITTDGDADRPLIADETGAFLRGDLVGALTAGHCGIRQIATPVTSNSRLETCGLFQTVVRTRVGSPYVIAALAEAVDDASPWIGFEANGGVILSHPISREGRTLAALPTRDAMLPILAVLAEMARQRRPLSQIVAALGFATALSTRIEHVGQERSAAFLERLRSPAFQHIFFEAVGGITAHDSTDGERFSLQRGGTVHFRASGNAPELRIYAEADDAATAHSLLAWAEHAARKQLGA
jgi:phosphomannomutase